MITYIYLFNNSIIKYSITLLSYAIFNVQLSVRALITKQKDKLINSGLHI